MLLNHQKNLLQPVSWQIGRLGEAPDVHPGVILDLTQTLRTFRDGTSRMVDAAIIAIQVTAQAENGGHTYITLARRGEPIPTDYLWPRARGTADGESLLIPGLDDVMSVEEVQARLQEDNARAVESNAFGLSARANERKAEAKDGLAV